MSHVLIVEDDADQREIRRLLFERHDYEVSEAATAATALTLAKQKRPGVVVMDLRLPSPEDGCELIRGLSGIAPDLPILVLAGFPDDLKGRAEAALVKEILKKPCRSRLLLAFAERFTQTLACVLVTASIVWS